jgi:thymidylate synthase
MNKLDDEYLKLCYDILENGIIKSDRTGTGTISVFGREIRFTFDDDIFPLLTTKKMAWKTMVTELIWFLRGDTNIKFLINNNCNIWNGDAYKYYKNNCKEKNILSEDQFVTKIKTDDEFSRIWGELGPIYGKQWRNWNGIDQISNLIKELNNNPDSRRLIVNAWNVSDIDKVVLPPCHYTFQCNTTIMSTIERQKKFNTYIKYNKIDIINMSVDDAMKHYNFPERKLSLKFNMRSVDVPLGLPMNIASYGLLLKILSNITNMIPNELIASLGDTHIYLNQIDGIKKQLKNKPYNLPSVNLKLKNVNINNLKIDDFELINYISHEQIKMPLSN